MTRSRLTGAFVMLLTLTAPLVAVADTGYSNLFTIDLRSPEPDDLLVEDVVVNNGQAVTAWEPVAVSFVLRNVGGSTWEGRDLTVVVSAVDVWGEGHDSASFAFLLADMVARTSTIYTVAGVGALGPGEASTVTVDDYVFTAPDFTDRLWVEVLGPGGGELDSGFSSNDNDWMPLAVGFNWWALYSCLGTILSGATAGTVDAGHAVQALEAGLIAGDYALLVNAFREQVEGRRFVAAGATAVKFGLNALSVLPTPWYGFVKSAITELEVLWGGGPGGCGSTFGHLAVMWNDLVIGMWQAMWDLLWPLKTDEAWYVLSASGGCSLTVTTGGASTSIEPGTQGGEGIPESAAFAVGDMVFVLVAVPRAADLEVTVEAEGGGPPSGEAMLTIGRSEAGGGVTRFEALVALDGGDVASGQVTDGSGVRLAVDRGGDGTVDETVEMDERELLPEEGTVTASGYSVPVVAHNPGAGGTQWLSDAWLWAPQRDELTVVATFYPGAGGDPVSGQLNLGGEMMAVSDVVGFLGASGSGSLVLEPGEPTPLQAPSRTFNNASSGTYGQLIPGQATVTAVGLNDDPLYLPQLARSGSAGVEGFRTNLGVTEVAGASGAVEVELCDASGATLATATIAVEPFRNHQVNDIFALHGVTEVSSAYARVRVSQGQARVMPYASVVDNRTGDPIYIPAMADSALGGDLVIPAAAHTPGAEDTSWVTDLRVLNVAARGRDVVVTYTPTGEPGAAGTSRRFTVAGGEQLALDDVVLASFGVSQGSGSLRLGTDPPGQMGILATSRTYNDSPSGTFGQLIPAVDLGVGIGHGSTAALVPVMKSAAFRSNVGVVEVGGQPVTVTLILVSAAGEVVGSMELDLPSGGHRQVNDVFAATGVAALALARCEVEVVGDGRVIAYASVVDNRSGDPVYIPASGGGGAEPPPSQDEITITLPGGVPMELVHIPAGTFQMGSPGDERGRYDREDLHRVTLTRGYYLGRTEVTQAQWEAVMGSSPASAYGVGDDYPVYYVSWNDICGGSTGADCAADSFIGRLNAYLGTSVFRLPTEAEWERAARAGTQTRYSHGDALECDDECDFCDLHDRHMWWCGNNDPYGTKPVGTKLPNAYGLYDMHGNVHEWVADWHTSSLGTGPQTDPTGPGSGSYRVSRGGGWPYLARSCRSANRLGSTPSYRYSYFGFRLARSE